MWRLLSGHMLLTLVICCLRGGPILPPATLTETGSAFACILPCTPNPNTFSVGYSVPPGTNPTFALNPTAQGGGTSPDGVFASALAGAQVTFGSISGSSDLDFSFFGSSTDTVLMSAVFNGSWSDSIVIGQSGWYTSTVYNTGYVQIAGLGAEDQYGNLNFNAFTSEGSDSINGVPYSATPTCVAAGAGNVNCNFALLITQYFVAGQLVPISGNYQRSVSADFQVLSQTGGFAQNSGVDQFFFDPVDPSDSYTTASGASYATPAFLVGRITDTNTTPEPLPFLLVGVGLMTCLGVRLISRFAADWKP
jgi:hypothetical protein